MEEDFMAGLDTNMLNLIKCLAIMLESGIPLETISHALGHSSVSTTYDIYCGEMDGRDNIRDFLNEKMDPVNYYTK